MGRCVSLPQNLWRRQVDYRRQDGANSGRGANEVMQNMAIDAFCADSRSVGCHYELFTPRGEKTTLVIERFDLPCVRARWQQGVGDDCLCF